MSSLIHLHNHLSKNLAHRAGRTSFLFFFFLSLSSFLFEDLFKSNDNVEDRINNLVFIFIGTKNVEHLQVFMVYLTWPNVNRQEQVRDTCMLYLSVNKCAYNERYSLLLNESRLFLISKSDNNCFVLKIITLKSIVSQSINRFK